MMGITLKRCASCVLRLRMGGADRVPPGPAGRGPFDKSDSFVLPDGRLYQPGDACSDDIYGIDTYLYLYVSNISSACGGMWGVGFWA